MQKRVLFADSILPSDQDILIFIGFSALALACIGGFAFGLKLQLNGKRRLGIWMAWSCLAAAACVGWLFWKWHS